MTKGTITNNNVNSYGHGGGVCNHGESKISGDAAITGNNGGSYGGGVYIYSGEFEMSGNAAISGNTASDGGGVYNTATFTMKGGTITGNTAYYGGGMFNEEGTFTMKGGTITGHTASYGGGVYISGGEFEMSGNAAITGNTASNGGGVYMTSQFISPIFTMTSGTLCNNGAKAAGDDVYNKSRYATVNLPAISDKGWRLDTKHGGSDPNGSAITGWFYDGAKGNDGSQIVVTPRWNNRYVEQFTDASFKGSIALKAAYGLKRVSIQYYLDDANTPLDTPLRMRPLRPLSPRETPFPIRSRGCKPSLALLMKSPLMMCRMRWIKSKREPTAMATS